MSSTAPSSEPGDPVVGAADGTPSVTDTATAPRRRRRVVAVALPLLIVVVLVWLASCAALSLTSSKQPIGAGGSGGGRAVSSDAFAAGFSVTGDVTVEIRPGVDAPIDVRVENPYSGALRVSGVRVEITGVQTTGVAPGVGAGAPDPDAGASAGATPGTAVDGGRASASGCSAADFTVVQSTAGLRIPEGETRSLSQLDVPVADWPRIALASAERAPDACRGVTLTLAFRADGEVR
ncbi:hypothetical protein GCM10027515_12740 [Schumannella luteola]|uniref:Uncharacterized protein n=1 Tax=Schumannella luteola TaxID=472059 RepID=A0A852Y767_9MICO|nr:hypothetical protein [Schumannella luteola]NYG97722.1 hypothetical protein [Schumannella luteola]TPX01411.1 hypothetical protein FJ656_27620 [Schumannella luteola]